MAAPVAWLHAFIDVPAESVGATLDFWSAVTGWSRRVVWDGHPEFTSLVPPDGHPYLHVQRIDGAPRVHVDLIGDPDAETARLARFGATAGYRGTAWQVMASPTGLPFCVCDERWPHHRSAATTWPDGHRSRVVQVSVDVPFDRHDTEWGFWRDATGWVEEPLRRPEFRRLVHRETSALQLLVQRLGVDDDAVAARAHLDLGTDDMLAEVERLQTLGAEVLWPGDGFVAMRDPIGLPYCVTTNDPDR